MMTRQIRIASIEDYLGPADNRFFGAGYRRATYALSPLTMNDASLSGSVGVSYPSDWSLKKQGVDLRPHLSTVDVMLLAAQFSDLILAERVGLDAPGRSRSWLRKIVLLAGTEPQEELDAIPVSARLVSTKPGAGEQQVTSLVDCRVGAMRAKCYVVHERSDTPISGGPSVVTDIDKVLGPAASRYWGGAYRADNQTITDVIGDVDELLIRARLGVGHAGPPATAGLGGGYPAPVTFVDAFVGMLQLTQVLLYQIDQVKRSETNTLWMQQTTLQADAPSSHTGPDCGAEVAITRKNLLSINGHTWRDVDVSGSAAGISLRCTFAHQLTEQAALTAI